MTELPDPPVQTYRIQLGPEHGLDAAADAVDYLAALGVTHLYLSPILQAAPGSTHGYDVVDHARVSAELGGLEAFERLATAARARGMGLVVDVVPNHVAVPTPLFRNHALWSVLRDGPTSPFATWFDIEWSVADRAVLMPVLGQRIGQVLDAGELALDEVDVPDGHGRPVRERVLRYYEHVLPLREGTAHLPLPELVDRQWYRLAHWRVGAEELNYRRFFDIDTLAALRVEDPAVFDASHGLLLDLWGRGLVQGLRIDHPDGLADPRGYLARLAARARAVSERGARPWVVVEKILEGEEQLPSDWECDGTTGYDTLVRITGVMTNPFAAGDLQGLYADLVGEGLSSFETVVEEAKREIVTHVLYAEVARLVDLLVDICHDDVRLRDHTRRGLTDAVVELLVAMDRYRAYVVPGEPAPEEAVRVVRAAAERARTRLGEERHDTLEAVVGLVLGEGLSPAEGSAPGGRAADGGAARADGRPRDAERRHELVVRFQQTCGPVMAKGVEDTAFYRWHRLVALNEVGGDPSRFGVSPEEVHAYFARVVAERPVTMTALTTHDTKRSEDARARLLAAVDDPKRWAEAVRAWHHASTPLRRDGMPEGPTEYLVWQTLVAAWPISEARLVDYVTKAMREAKLRTTWTRPDEAYEAAVLDFCRGVLADTELSGAIAAYLDGIAPYVRAVVLGQKLVQLTMPGVADVYQGTELVTTTLVDPDNRRPVDYAERRARLGALDAGALPRDLDDEKLRLTAKTLRLRRARPDVFRGPRSRYWPLPASTSNAFAFGRGTDADEAASAFTVVTRRPADLDRLGGWAEHVVTLPDGAWEDVLTGQPVAGGPVRLADLLARSPVALLARPG